MGINRDVQSMNNSKAVLGEFATKIALGFKTLHFNIRSIGGH